MANHVSIKRFSMTGGERPGLMNVEAHILSSKNEMRTDAVVRLIFDVTDDPRLSVIQQRILSEASRNLAPDEAETEQ